MSAKADALIEYNIQDALKIIVSSTACSVSEAMERLYRSRVFAGLADPQTGLYLESPSYLWELLLREEQGGAQPQ